MSYSSEKLGLLRHYTEGSHTGNSGPSKFDSSCNFRPVHWKVPGGLFFARRTNVQQAVSLLIPHANRHVTIEFDVEFEQRIDRLTVRRTGGYQR
jgi:hypothetical protein